MVYQQWLAALAAGLLVACGGAGSVDSSGGTGTGEPPPTGSNTAPSVVEIPDQKMGTRGRLGPFSLALNDEETAATDLQVSAVSSDPSIVPNSAIVITENDGIWTASIEQPASVGDFGAVGDTDITVTVSDGELAATATFTLSVLPRINQYVAMGTHNSYHEKGLLAGLVADWNYSHDSLDKQLLEHRVRSFELDIHWSPLQYMQVYHVSALDPVSMCDRFGADPSSLTMGCLEMIKAGLDANPNSLPAMIMIEPKDSFPEDPNEGSLVGHWRDFDNDIRAVFPEPAEGEEDQLITPAQVLGSCDSLAEAVRFDTTCGGWPHIDEARGKALVFVMASNDCSTHGRDYREQNDDDCDSTAGGNPVQNWVAFLENDSGPNAAISRCDNPNGDCFGEGNSVADAAQTGVLIRTRSDSPPSNNAEQCAFDPNQCPDYTPVCLFDYDPEVASYETRLADALASGAHMVSTEHPANPYPDDEVNDCPNNESYARFLAYAATIDGKGSATVDDPSALCNPANAPANCEHSLFIDAAQN
jgi:hypothetical protein